MSNDFENEVFSLKQSWDILINNFLYRQSELQANRSRDGIWIIEIHDYKIAEMAHFQQKYKLYFCFIIQADFNEATSETVKQKHICSVVADKIWYSLYESCTQFS